MRVVPAIAAAVLMLNAGLVRAQAPITPGVPPPQVVPPPPDTVVPAAPGQTAPAAPVTPAAPAVAAVPLTRTFTATTGMLFNTVRPERVKDFETVLWYLQQALQKSTDPTVRMQAAGWKIFKALEPGPNAVALYVFVLDPAVPGADYGLGRILADAYPEQIQEIWKLYQGSVTSGGTLLNLNGVDPLPPLPVVPLTPGGPGTAPQGRTPPPPAENPATPRP
jgi:hypothetical protein